MGSPLAPILDNIFMGFQERNWVNNYNNTKPSFYRRYVDNIFLYFWWWNWGSTVFQLPEQTAQQQTLHMKLKETTNCHFSTSCLLNHTTFVSHLPTTSQRIQDYWWTISASPPTSLQNGTDTNVDRQSTEIEQHRKRLSTGLE